MTKAIVLLSGGLDSVVSLALSRKQYSNILALTFNYGQKSFNKEKKAAQNVSQYYSLEHKIVDLDWLSVISNSSLNNSGAIPNIDKSKLDDVSYTRKTASSVWVPNRNGLFINIAACYADAYNYDEIIFGANREESVSFKDNSKEFIIAINESLKNSTNSNVKVIAPLSKMSKLEIVKCALDMDVPLKLIYSCYQNGEKHCGMCESCQRLKRALELNNRQDIIQEIFVKD